MAQPQPGAGSWYWEVGGQQVGPVPLAHLQRLVRSGQIGPQVQVWTDGMLEPVAAGNVPVLYQAPIESGVDSLLYPTGPQSGFSIAAGYCGLIGLGIPIVAPLGIVFGLLGLRDLRAHPDKRGKGRALTGIITGGLAITIWLMVIGSAIAHRH